MGINFNLIATLFEGVRLIAYVPEPDGGEIESGVTIAAGYDIGQRKLSDIPEILKEKFAPYCGLVGNDAIKALKEKPLTITKEECEFLVSYSHAEAVDALLSDWDRHASYSWEEVPDGIQTAIASVAFQYGDLPSRCPMFWRQAITKDWEGMKRNLWDFGDDFVVRRRQEYMLVIWETSRMIIPEGLHL